MLVLMLFTFLPIHISNLYSLHDVLVELKGEREFLWDAWPGEVSRARLPLIRCPVLCVQGEHDEVGTPQQLRTFQNLIRHFRSCPFNKLNRQMF